VFNALHSLDAVRDAEVVDVFAGSGALGIEALSRGARRVTFVEQHREAIRAIRTNLDATGLAERATVVPMDVDRWLAGSARGQRFDLALVDPPYAFEDWASLVERLPATLVVMESGREVATPPGWEALRSRRYGGTVVTFIRRTPDGQEPADRTDDHPDPNESER
jgi:16S rRNA (guanine966-N2)-methyltransferase